MKPFIIAEIGSNCLKYNDEKQNLNLAFDQIRQAKKAGASAVKFQMFTSKELYGETVPDVDRWSMPRSFLPHLALCCNEEKIEFMCSAFSVEGYICVDRFVRRHKVASAEAGALDLCRWLWGQRKPVIWSNGCGKINTNDRPNDIVMDCVAKYPAVMADYAFRTPETSRKGEPRYKFGLSDHTLNSDLAKFYRARGCDYFERHVDLVRGKSDTPDQCVSIGYNEFSDYIDDINAQERISVPVNQRVSNKAFGRRLIEGRWLRPLPGGKDA